MFRSHSSGSKAVVASVHCVRPFVTVYFLTNLYLKHGKKKIVYFSVNLLTVPLMAFLPHLVGDGNFAYYISFLSGAKVDRSADNFLKVL